MSNNSLHILYIQTVAQGHGAAPKAATAGEAEEAGAQAKQRNARPGVVVELVETTT